MPVFTIPIHEVNDCHEPAGSPMGGQFCASTPTLRYFNLKYGGFTPRARRAWLARSPAARRGVVLARAAWQRKYGKKAA